MTPTPLALQGWAERWSIPAPCLADLLQCMGVGDIPPEPPTPTNTSTEAWTQSTVTLEAPRYGVWLTRNNVGAMQDDRGRVVRYGLCNESKQRNAVLKSADLIGIKPVVITARMVGCTIGQFVSRECKRPGWTYKGDAHETAQANWAALVTRYGGDARFVTGEGSFG